MHRKYLSLTCNCPPTVSENLSLNLFLARLRLLIPTDWMFTDFARLRDMFHFSPSLSSNCSLISLLIKFEWVSFKLHHMKSTYSTDLVWARPLVRISKLSSLCKVQLWTINLLRNTVFLQAYAKHSQPSFLMKMPVSSKDYKFGDFEIYHLSCLNNLMFSFMSKLNFWFFSQTSFAEGT